MQEAKDPLRHYAIRTTGEYMRRDTSTPQAQKSYLERAKSFPGAQSNTAYVQNSFHSQDNEESYELNYNAIFCCLAIILLVIACLVFFLSGLINSPRAASEVNRQKHLVNSTVAHPGRSERFEFSLFKNLTSTDEKRNFLYSELNSLLSKYNGSINEIELSYNRMSMVANQSNLTEFSNLHLMFVERYQDFFKSFNCAQSGYKMMLDISSQYNDIETKIHSNKERMIILLQQQDELEAEKTRATNEIEKLKGLQEEQKKLFEFDIEKLKDAQSVVQKYLEEIKLLDCNEVLRKMEEYKSNKMSLETEIDNYKQRLQNLELIIRESQNRTYTLAQSVQEKEKLKDVADLDYRTLLKMKDLMAELDKFENEKATQLRSRILDTLNILKEKFQLLLKRGQLDEVSHEKEKLFYHNATQMLKQHIQLLVRMKRVYQNERKLVFEGLKLHGNPDEIEKREYYLEKELKGMKKEYEKLHDQLESDQNDQSRLQQALATSQRKLNDVIVRLNATAETANHCTVKMKQREKANDEYERKKNETYTLHKIALSTLEDETKVRLVEEKDYTEKIRLNVIAIYDLQTQISGLVSTLAQNYHKLNEERHIFAEKTQRASNAYKDVQNFKLKLIECLNHFDEMSAEN